MDPHDTALMMAGVMGSGVAIVHGVLTQRHMVRPLVRKAGEEKPLSAPIVRLIPGLLHYSTLSWFLGGLALIAAAIWFGPEAKLATSLLVGGSYLYGVLVNLWATRGRHPGWMLLGVAVALIVVGVSNHAFWKGPI